MLKPGCEAELVDHVRIAMDRRTPVAIMGAGTKQAMHGPVAADPLSLAGLVGITLYEPDELVMTVMAGTPMTMIEASLAAYGQHLGFEVPDYAALFAGEPGCQTIGGVLAANLAGPRRFTAGAARDHLLGFRAVNGTGEVFKSGGRVVKNVTGYDLSKFICGSWGTLALMTEVTMKVLPRPERCATLLIPGDDPAEAVRRMVAALQSPQDISGAAWISAGLVPRIPVSAVTDRVGVTAIRLEGTAASTAFRLGAVQQLYAKTGGMMVLDDASSVDFWAAIRDASAFFGTNPDQILWRISLPVMASPGVLSALTGTEAMLDWGGGLIWLQSAAGTGTLEAYDDAGAGVIRPLVNRLGGSATLFRAPSAIRMTQGTLDRPSRALSDLIGRVKAAFDPQGLFNPGRLYPITPVMG